MKKNALFSWESPQKIPFKTMISAVSIFSNRLFLATFSGSIFCVNLENFFIDVHINFEELVVPIRKLLVFSDFIQEIQGFLATSSGFLYYFSAKYNDQNQITKEKTLLLTKKFENSEIVEILYSQVMEILVLANKTSVFIYKTVLEHGENSVSILNEQKAFETEEEIFQIDMSGPKLLISTFRNYYILNIFSKTLIKIGLKEKKGFYGGIFLAIENEELAFAGRNQGILWKIDSSTGKVLTSLQFVDNSSEKLSFGRFFSMNNGILLSFDGKNLFIIDLKSKELLGKKACKDSWVILWSNPLKKKKKTQQNQRVFVIKQENGEICLEIGKIVEIEGLFENAVFKGNIEEIARLIINNEGLQNIENVKKLQEFEQFQKIFEGNFQEKMKKNREISEEKTRKNGEKIETEEKLKEKLHEKMKENSEIPEEIVWEDGFIMKFKGIIEEIERKWNSERICHKMDFFQNIVRKEEIREKSRISSCFLLRNSNENYLKIHEVSPLITKNPENFDRIIRKNYEEKDENPIKIPLKKNSTNFINFFNEKVRKIRKKTENHVKRLEFFEKTREFFHFTKENQDFKGIIDEILLYEDEILLSFMRKNAIFFINFRKLKGFCDKFAEIRSFRALSHRKNAFFFIKIAKNEIKGLFLQFIQETEKIIIKEKEIDFLEKASLFLQI